MWAGDFSWIGARAFALSSSQSYQEMAIDYVIGVLEWYNKYDDQGECGDHSSSVPSGSVVGQGSSEVD